ncbi:hypothetical protein KIW84_063143 [Lathyrus oleraceus]|uniref:Uncharacterized protein n=1 Tax=Pisum sativum TaxID=3888 RepID=A0A9D4W866_PEA|nr:hypothetical protein KIW84_063143 [Pisum sativum]
MASLFRKCREAVKTLAKRPSLTKDPRQLQFEADVNRLFLYSSYNQLGKSADESDAEKIIEKASNTSFADQAIQVQENVHTQIKTFCAFMDEILLPNEQTMKDPLGLSQQASVLPRRSGLSLAVGRNGSSPDNSAVVIDMLLEQLALKQDH